jgi:hypothetical protein
VRIVRNDEGHSGGDQCGAQDAACQVRYYKRSNTDAASGTKVQIPTQLLVQKYKY